MSSAESSAVHDYLTGLQDRICAALEAQDGGRFDQRSSEGGSGVETRPRVLSEGLVLERAAVLFSHARGPALPPAATARRPELAGQAFEAVSLSLIVHPRNPYAPTSHANLRFFRAGAGDGGAWWFGGGFDLTPVYPFREDCVHWHRTARTACTPFGDDVYPRFKKACDEYFFLAHRGEARGIGGLFFDDFAEGGFERAFALVRSVGDHYVPAYAPIVERRKKTPYGERERGFQQWRRGRYVEFNLVYDRGTRYGLQSGRRIESVLASMPPLAAWRYDFNPEAGSAEEELMRDYLRPRDWADEIP